jgi:sensor histidine kinase regulating citrate/malate metabolism
LRYRELYCRSADFFRHDLKNYQNAILMALDLYRLKNDDKYLDKIDEVLQTCLEYLGNIKKVEPHIVNGGFLGYYSCFSTIRQAMNQHPSQSFEISGDDCFVLADSSFLSIFELLFLNIFQDEKDYETSFFVSKFVEDEIPKCCIDVTFRGFSVSQPFVDDILKENALCVTGSLLGICLYVAKTIAYRCEGKLFLKETNDKQTTFSLILLQESDYISKLLPLF